MECVGGEREGMVRRREGRGDEEMTGKGRWEGREGRKVRGKGR